MTYETTVNSLGYWGVTLESEKFKDGNHLVTAQAINSEGKGSQVVSMVTLSKVDLDKLARDLSAETGMGWTDRLGIVLFYGAPAIGLLFSIILIVILVKRHKKKKAEEASKEASGAKKDPATHAEGSAKESTTEPTPKTGKTTRSKKSK